MRRTSPEVAKHMDNLSDKAGAISALAIDQKGSSKRMLAEAANKPADETIIVDSKETVSKELVPYVSAILTDPEYGLPATKIRGKNCGLSLPYEKTGYDATEPGRMCDLIADQPALRIRNDGTDTVRLLLYYDPDESDEINDKEKAFAERVGAGTKANGLPLSLELLIYDGKTDDVKSEEYAEVKPEKVFKTIEEFSEPQYDVTALKVEIPSNVKYVEGFNDDNNVAYTQEEAKELLKKQSDSIDLPHISLSVGITSGELTAGIKTTEETDADFNGILYGRITWRPAIKSSAVEGEKQSRERLSTEGKKNIENLDDVPKDAKSWKDKLEAED